MTQQSKALREVLRKPELRAYDGMKDEQRRTAINNGKYPKPFKLIEGGRAVAWWKDEILEWQRQRDQRRIDHADEQEGQSRRRVRVQSRSREART